ncbi:EF-hand calcium-binding domain-containing protein 5 [Harpia harpyja]|uniref:EF-hand calcium-binding domain-containing protein 5 n=1 Tax=Harpia harpyja TaxID=202280 RepID=UPI0022B14138|nr:EF-hand calcium-binding domain-containing protein 5 [Harpia harpyja]XP_052660918.1 EF-hand calcium-binding domain-containing protein 5 [Harpia harpyja]XP_052660919.1 EF-hand calcium-binding domain-containing protein 5 [Harpia harpyja]XP_052660920.1 EF-hand calcium-binding domain-containing protein 5 [Harpia harpyja]
MAAQPEAAAQTAGLKHPKLGGKNLTATEMKRNQGNDELPCLSNYALWKECFYEKVQQRCLSLQETKVKMIRAQKAKEEKVKKRELCDWLSKEWFSEEKESLDTRIYLLDKLLPTLIPGMEKLLMEVERKNVLAPGKEPTKFNPICFLGEYLMRHNPQYSISTKPSPYLRGMKMVTEELKTEMPGTTSERLARMKVEAKNKRKDREQVDNMKSQMKEMRKEVLAIQFKEWTVDVSGRIPVALVQSALRSFPDVIASAPIDVRKAICDRKLEIVETLEKKVNIDEFTEYVHSYTEHFSNDMFQEILKHLGRCADDFQEAIRHDTWRQMFADLFLDCDYGKVGLLDRQKILALLIDFYDRSPVIAKRGFCNPRQWPIIELQEIELVDLWGDLDDQEVCEELSEKLVLSQTGIFEGGILASESVGDNRQGTYGMRTSVREGLFEQKSISEAETGGISEEENQAAESSDAELRKEGEDAASAVKSADFEASDLDGDTIHREKSSFREDIKTERQTKSASADRQEEAFPGSASPGYSLSRDGEPGSEKQVEEEEFSPGREPDTETNREEDYHILDGERGSEEQVCQKEDNGIAEATNTISGPAPEAITTTSEDRAVADMDIIASKQDAPVAEVVKETSARKESFSKQHGSQFGQQTSSETRLQDEDLLQDQGKGPAHSDRQDSPAETSEEFEMPWSGDFLTCDLSCRYSSYGARIPEDWKRENTRFPDLHPIMAEIQNRWASRTRSAFDESCLNLPQFVQLMETFVGEDISLPTVKRFIAFIKEEYKQTEDEKIEQLEKVHRISRLAQRKLLLEALFEKWDNNASGFLDLEEVDAVLSTFKEGMEKEALRKAKKHLCCRYPQLSRVGKLSPKAFQTFLELVASEFPGNENEAIDNLVEFLTASVEQSRMKCLQSLTRRKWLYNIQQAAETSGASMEPVYKAVFKALSQDAETHGDNKISAYIALLEENQLSPERGQILLHYVACTADDAPYVLNQILYRDMKGVSFAAVEEGKPIHVPRVQLHGSIHFWNYDRPVEERKGSLLILPLHDARWRAFGILGLDTLRDQCEKTIFLTHEVSFYQGVSHAFSKAYHHICTLENVLQMTVTALDWLYPRAPSIHTVITYLVEPGKDKTWDYALRKMITTDNTGQKENHSSPVLLLRKENLLRDYLFKCTDSSQVIYTSVCGEYHIAVPLRDLSGQALGIFDISIGRHQKLPPQEHKDLQKTLKMAQAACFEILKMSLEETEPTYVLEVEHMANLRHAGILFHRFMLQDLRECVQKLDAESFAEIKSYVEPPALVHNIVKAVLLLLHPNWKGSEKTENWSQCKLKLDDSLIQEIYCFDPTAASVQVQAELLLDCITGVPRAAVWQQGSAPAEYLYHWVDTCLLLAEITRSLHSKTTPPLATFGTQFQCTSN